MMRLVAAAPDAAAVDRRAYWVPIVSTMIASATALLPTIALSPAWPPLGLLVLLAWRLLRPEIWPVWIGLPLGLADDLLTGQTLGTGMVMWTLCLIAIEAVEGRLLWRDYWQEWLVAAALIAAAILGSWAVASWTGGAAPVVLVLPQMAASILCFPVVGRLCALLDRWRLAQGKIRPPE